MTFFKIVLACLLAIGIVNFASVLVELSLRSQVYACSSDKEVLPEDIAIQCKRLTKGQWWHK
jgi:hypothetical protein